MIAAIELGKKYAQVCVKTDSMTEPESLSLVAGTENYRIPVDVDLEKQEELKEFFRKLWKLIMPYGAKDSLESLIFCLEEPSEQLRQNILNITDSYDISKEIIGFTEKKECFCAYVYHQPAEILAYHSLLIENEEGVKTNALLSKMSRTTPVLTKIKDLSEKTLEQIFADYRISSVFLVGDDFEEDWMNRNLRLLKGGRRIFAGKNLYAKGACYLGMERQEPRTDYFYVGGDKVCCNIGLKSEEGGKESVLMLSEAGKNWYDSDVVAEVLLMEGTEIEFLMMPINGTQKQISVELKDLPQRPKKTTRLQISLEFTDACHAKVNIRDLGFGELFPASDRNYEGELQWEQ